MSLKLIKLSGQWPHTKCLNLQTYFSLQILFLHSWQKIIVWHKFCSDLARALAWGVIGTRTFTNIQSFTRITSDWNRTRFLCFVPIFPDHKNCCDERYFVFLVSSDNTSYCYKVTLDNSNHWTNHPLFTSHKQSVLLSRISYHQCQTDHQGRHSK